METKPYFPTYHDLKKPITAKIKGTLPSYCNGVFIRLAPAYFDFENGPTLNHFLDGFACLSKFTINDGEVIYDRKFVDTFAYKQGIKHGKLVTFEYGTSGFTDPDKGIFQKIKSALIPDQSDNVATNLFEFNGQIFLCNDFGKFLEFELEFMKTKNRFSSRNLFGLHSMTSHFLKDKDGSLYNIGIRIKPLGTNIEIIHIPKPEGNVLNEKTFKKARVVRSFPARFKTSFPILHSSSLTKKFVIVLEDSVYGSFRKILNSTKPGQGQGYNGCLDFKPETKMRFTLIDKKSGAIPSTEYLTEKGYMTKHFVNSFEDEKDQIVVDLVAHPDNVMSNQTLDIYRKGEVVESKFLSLIMRYIIPVVPHAKDVPEGENLLKISKHYNTTATAIRKGEQIILTGEPLFKVALEFPHLNPRVEGTPYTYFYGHGGYAFHSGQCNVYKLNSNTKTFDTWSAKKGELTGSPVFIPNLDPNAEEDDGVVISTVRCFSHSSPDYVIFLDGKTFKEIGRAELYDIPVGVHGLFINK